MVKNWTKKKFVKFKCGWSNYHNSVTQKWWCPECSPKICWSIFKKWSPKLRQMTFWKATITRLTLIPAQFKTRSRWSSGVNSRNKKFKWRRAKSQSLLMMKLRPLSTKKLKIKMLFIHLARSETLIWLLIWKGLSTNQTLSWSKTRNRLL